MISFVEFSVLSLEKLCEFFNNLLRLLHPALAFETAGEETALWLDDMIAKGTQALHVLLRRGMRIHIEVHSWRNEYWSLHRQISSNQHIISNSVSHLTQRRSRTGSYQHGIGPQAKIHMRVPRAVALREELADDRLLRQ